MQATVRSPRGRAGCFPAWFLVNAIVVAEATVLLSFAAILFIVNPSVMGWMTMPGTILDHYLPLFIPLLVALAWTICLAVARARGVYPGDGSLAAIHLAIAALSYSQVVLIIGKQEHEPSLATFTLYIIIFSLVLVSMIDGRDRRDPRPAGQVLAILAAVSMALLLAGTVLVPAFLFMVTCAVHGAAGLAGLATSPGTSGQAFPAGIRWLDRFTPRPVPRHPPAGSVVIGIHVLLEGIFLACGIVLAFDGMGTLIGMVGSPDAIFLALAGVLVHWATWLGLGIVVLAEVMLPRFLPVATAGAARPALSTMTIMAIVAFLLATHAGVPVLSIACTSMLFHRLVVALVSMKGAVRPVITYLFIVVTVAGFARVVTFDALGVPAGVLDLVRGSMAIVVAVAALALVPVAAWLEVHRHA